MDERIALVGLIWFLGFTIGGDQIGRVLFSTPGTGATLGFFLALLLLMAWPFIMPNALQRWMHDGD